MTELADIAAALAARTDSAAGYGEEIQRLTEEFDFEGLLQLASLRGRVCHQLKGEEAYDP